MSLLYWRQINIAHLAVYYILASFTNFRNVVQKVKYIIASAFHII